MCVVASLPKGLLVDVIVRLTLDRIDFALTRLRGG